MQLVRRQTRADPHELNGRLDDSGELSPSTSMATLSVAPSSALWGDLLGWSERGAKMIMDPCWLIACSCDCTRQIAKIYILWLSKD